MARQSWMCDKCDSPYRTKEGAESCEKRHKEIDGAIISAFGFNPKGDGRSNIYPSTVVIRFSEMFGDFAEYKISHIGPRGM